MLKVRDPLSERVHLGPVELLGLQPRRHRRRDDPPRDRDGGPCPNRRPAHDARDGGGQRRITGRPRPAVRSTRRCASCRASSARRCSRSTVSAGRSTTSPIPTARGPSGWPRCSNGATISTRCIRAIRRRGCGTTSPRFRSSASSARIFWPSSTAWKWTCRRISARRISPRSTCIATASRARSDGCRCGCSVCREDDGILLAHHLGRALQLTNILRDIDEDAGIGRLYLPREGLLHAGITGDRSAQGDRRSGAAESLRAAGRAGADAFREGRRNHGPQSAARGARAADHVEILSRDPGIAGRTGLCSAARAGSRQQDRAASPSSSATHSSDAKDRPHHRRRNFGPLGGRSAGQRRISRCMSTRPRNRPAAAAGPISTRRPTSPSTTAIICCCPATAMRWPTRDRSAPRQGWSGRSARNFRSSISRPASAGSSTSATAGCRCGCSTRRAACPIPACAIISH